VPHRRSGTDHRARCCRRARDARRVEPHRRPDRRPLVPGAGVGRGACSAHTRGRGRASAPPSATPIPSRWAAGELHPRIRRLRAASTGRRARPAALAQLVVQARGTEPFEDRLGALLEWEGALQAELRSRGHTLYLEPAARTTTATCRRRGPPWA
jgi:hypothetical protein